MAALTEKEQKDFRDMITACGRTVSDFQLSLSASNGNIVVTNTVKSRNKEYIRDENGAWVLTFATDMKKGEM